VSWLAALGRFIGGILAEILPGLIAQWKKPREVQVHGGDREVRDDIARQIEEDSVRSIGGTRIGPVPDGQMQHAPGQVEKPEDRPRGAGD
jgi:hypothetical protein